MDFVSSINEMNPVAKKFQLGNKIAGAIGGLGWYPDTLVEHLYVCAATGNDQFNGKSPLTPKLKIQAAIDAASTTKHTIIHLLTSFSAANTIYDFDDEGTIPTVAVTSGNERAVGAANYLYKSNLHFVGEGPPGSIVIKPAAAASAGIIAIKTGMANISFSNIAFDATTAAAASIKTSGTVVNLTIENCTFKLGTVQLDLDAGIITNPVIINNEFWDADTDFIAIAPLKGLIGENYIGFSVYLAAGGKITSGITFANTSGTGGTRIVNNHIQGGDDAGTNDVIATGILLAGTNTKAASIIGNVISNCDDQINDGGTDTLIALNFSEAGGTDATNVATDLTHLTT